MGIGLNQVVFYRDGDETLFTAVGSAAGLDVGQTGNNGIPAKEGLDSVEFHLTAAAQSGGIQTSAVTGFAGTTREVGCWFLNPGEEDGGSELIRLADDGIQLGIVHSGGTTYYNQGFLRGPDGRFPFGWMYLRASDNLTGITAIVPYVNNCIAPNNAKQDLEYQVDYAKAYDYIQIDGVGGTPTLDDIFQESITQDWGLVEKFNNFYVFNCGIEFLSGANFTATDSVIFLNHFSHHFKQNIIVRSGATVTLGVKSQPSTVPYAQNGCQLISPETPLNTLVKPAPQLLIEDGATFNAYDTLFQGFGDILFGETLNTADIELVKCDFYDNDNVEFRSTLLEATDIRLHQDSTDLGNLGRVVNAPALLKQVRVFNCTNALQFDVNTTVEEYIASNCVNDVVIKDPATVKLRNSSYDDTKLLRVV